MSEAPIPKPRTLNSQKKPIPLPRTRITTENSTNPTPLLTLIKDGITEKVQEQKKKIILTSKRISDDLQEHRKSVVESSKQFKDDMKDKVTQQRKAVTDEINDRKHAVFETTKSARQSLRSLYNRKFGTLTKNTHEEATVDDDKTKSLPASSEIFSNIQFDSPLEKNKFSDFKDEDSRSISPDLPPPSIPPPILNNDEDWYKEPQSLSSGSPSSYTGTLTSEKSDASPNLSDIDTASNCKEGDRASWSFYDVVNINDTGAKISDKTYYVDMVNKNSETKKIDRSSNESEYINVRLSNISSISVQNSIYENHILEPIQVREKKIIENDEKKFTQSMLLEFDPIAHMDFPTNQGNELSLSMLETLLQGDTYGTITNAKEYEQSIHSDESDIDECIPPPPPERFDSLLLENATKSTTSWFVEEPLTENKELKSQEKNNWMRQKISGVLKLVPESAKSIRRKSFRIKDEVNDNTKHGSKSESVPRPPINADKSITHQGMLIKVGRSRTVEDLFGDLNSRWCYLGENKFIVYADENMKVVKETIQLENVTSINSCVQNKYFSNDKNSPEEELYCFAITTTTKGIRGQYVFGNDKVTDQRLWKQKLIESLTSTFSPLMTTNFIHAGWVYLKEGSSGQWKGTWLLLHNRELVYCQNRGAKKCVDLRRARCIILQECDDISKSNSCGVQLLVDCAIGGALYICSPVNRDIRLWRNNIRNAAHNNGNNIDEQQLTNENVPVIVDKCINFIYAHGCMSEGIYRRSGSGKTVTELLSKFRFDAWSVQLSKDQYTEHDVACTLKRFFRNLPESLLTSKLRVYFHKIAEVHNTEEKLSMYKNVLEQLSPVSYQTLRKLITHLYFIQSQNENNQMNIKNLATVWGPTILHSEDPRMQFAQNDVTVVVDLISFKTELWPTNIVEQARERTMLSVLERYYKSSQISVAKNVQSGDLRVWIHLNTANSDQMFQVSLSPQKTAFDICQELCNKMNMPAYNLQLEESVLEGTLMRPIHFTEKVLDIVLRWGYWEDADRKNNCLVLKTNDLLKEISSVKDFVISEELKYADTKSKFYKSFVFEFSQARLSYYKDKSCSVKLGEWCIEDIIWYIGHEPKRDPHSRWSVTFISKKTPPKRSKTAPWFGHSIAGTDKLQMLKWLAALLSGEYPQGLLPPAIHVNLIEG